MSSVIRWICAGMLFAAGAAAAEMPVPKVMSDAPMAEGSWRMEVVEMPGVDKSALAGGAMTVCQTAAQAMARDSASREKSRCEMKLIEDSPTQAVMETRCGTGAGNRSTITRVAPRSYAVSVQDLAKPGAAPTRMKMSYVGVCSAKDSVISMGKDSAACQKARAQLAKLDPAKDCAKAGAQRAQCEQMAQQSRQSIEAMCK